MSIDKRPDGKYRARWREFPNGPQKSKQFDRKVERSTDAPGKRVDRDLDSRPDV